jgi:hypothetical protein
VLKQIFSLPIRVSTPKLSGSLKISCIDSVAKMGIIQSTEYIVQDSQQAPPLRYSQRLVPPLRLPNKVPRFRS